MTDPPKKKIRVCQVLEATGGGTRRHLKDVVAGLNPERFEVSVVCAVKRDPDFRSDIEAMKEAGHRVDVIPMVRPINPLFDTAAIYRLYGILRGHPADIVHTHSAKAGVIGRAVAKLTGVPCVVHTPHHFPFDMDVNRWSRRFYFEVERMAARLTDRIVCVCPQERESALRRDLTRPDKLVVIENGIDPREGDLDIEAIGQTRRELGVENSDGPVIGVVGRFCRQKGQRYLIDAAPEILRRMPETVFVFVGGGEDHETLVGHAVQLGVCDHCRFVEQRKNISAFYGTFDTIAIPSLWEGLPYTLLEALASGTPVAAFDTGGISDVVRNGENGLLVPPKDTAAFAEAICRIAADRTLRDRLGAAGRETVAEHYHLDNMITDLETMYSEILADK